MCSWQPQQQGLRELVVLLRDAANPNSRDHGLVNQRLSIFNSYPDYNSYLVYILIYSRKENIDIRVFAGKQLRDNIRNNFNSIPLTTLDYIKASCMQVLETPDPQWVILSSVSTIIVDIVRRGQVHNWLQIIDFLIEKLNHHVNPPTRFYLCTLVSICNAVAPELDLELEGKRPLQQILPILMTLYSHPDDYCKTSAMYATSLFIRLKSASVMQALDSILIALYARTDDKDPHVRQEFGRIVTVLLETFPEKLEPYLDRTIEYMLNATVDANVEIMLGACDFWQQCAHTVYYKDRFTPYLARLIPCLLNLMVYSDNDLLQFNQLEIQPQPVFTSTNNTKLQHHAVSLVTSVTTTVNQSQVEVEEEPESGDDDDISISSSNDDEDEENFDDVEFYSQDSLRQSGATTLEILSEQFGDEIATLLLDRLLNHTLQDSNWIVRESGILALGAAALGGIRVIRKDLLLLIPFLLSSMQDPQPLVRSIACWVISRFSDWLAAENKKEHNLFEPVLFGLLGRLLDTNRRVQESACSAFIVLAESAKQELIPYIYPILSHTQRAFPLYKKRKNIMLLYDALGTLADSVGKALNQPQYIYMLMPPLIAKWNELSDKDVDLFPLLQCLSNITAAVGPGFIQYVDPVLTRCVKLIYSTLQEQILADENPDEMMPPNVEFLRAPLDLLSGIVQGLGPKIEPLIAQTNPPLLALLGRCMQDPVPEVLKSTFALIGDIAGASFNLLIPYLHAMIRVKIQILHNHEYIIPVSVYNNVLWALGEIVMRWDPVQVKPYIPSLIEVLIPLLQHTLAPDSIHENAMIALGRLGLVCPMEVATHFRYFLKPWLEKSFSVGEGEEKDTAFRGLCVMIQSNARDAHKELYLLLLAFSSWEAPSQDLIEAMTHVVKKLHQKSSKEQWQHITHALDPKDQASISNLLSQV